MDPIFNSTGSEDPSDLHFMDFSSSSFSLDSSSDSEISSFPSPFQRLRVAPLRNFVSFDDFQKSSIFHNLECTIASAGKLLKKQEGLFDFDSEDGQRACKKFLKETEKLCVAFQVDTDERLYRNEFSQAYKVLYKTGSLCYLTEIIDSAQGRIPCLWVNSEKYIFSSESYKLHTPVPHFLQLLKMLRSVLEESNLVDLIIQKVRDSLFTFDRAWVEFEHMYVLELMVIEAHARRFIRSHPG